MCSRFLNQDIVFYLLFYVGKMDNPKIQIRSVDESGLENIASIIHTKHVNYRIFYFI